MVKNLFIILFLIIFSACQPVADKAGSGNGGFTIYKPVVNSGEAVTASSLTINNPKTASGYLSSISLLATGVLSGDTIKIYSDSTCTTLVTSKVATSTSAIIPVTVTVIGIYKFYTNSINTKSASSCSLNYARYEYLGVLPTNGSSFTLVSPTTTPNFLPTISFTVNGVVAGETVKVFTDASCTTLLASGVATGTSKSFTVGPLAIGNYKFYTYSSNATTSARLCSSNYLTYNYLGIPPTQATSIVRKIPLTATGNNPTPQFTLNGVVSGETIKLYSDSSCSTMVGSATAAGTTVDVTTTNLSIGTHTLYTATTNSSGTSSCSTHSIAYEFLGALATTGTLIERNNPAASSGYSSTLTVYISGVVSGETVRLYKDSSCATQLVSGTATSSSIYLTATGLPTGNHSFYTRSSNTFGDSACSAALTTYNFLGNLPTLATTISLKTPATTSGVIDTPTFTLTGVVSGETISLYSNSNCSTLKGSAVTTGTSVDITVSALTVGGYNFYTKSTNTQGSTSCSSFYQYYNFLGLLANPPSSITLTAPTITPNYLSTPTFSISGGVISGHIVKLYTDSACTALVGTATSTGTSVSITTSILPFAGVYDFYSTITNPAGVSTCSTVFATYTYNGISPTVRVSWTANKEKAVNTTGGGYRVYYSSSPSINTATASFVNVPYVSGLTAPTYKDFSSFLVGTYYFKVVAYSSLNTGSAASAEFSVSVP